MESNSLVPVLTPHGRLILSPADEGPVLEPGLARRLQESFARGSGHGLFQLGAGEVGEALPPAIAYWRELGARYVTALCTLPEAGADPSKVHVPAPPLGELQPLALASPPMTGAEYLTAEVLQALWQEMDAAFAQELAESGCSIQDFLKQKNAAWNLVGRVHFNLAENRRDNESPFAFLATYTTRLSAHAKAQHLPLGQALREYAGAAKQGSPALVAVARSSARLRTARGSKRWWTRVRSSIRCDGSLRTLSVSSRTWRSLRAPAWWCGCPPVGEPIGRQRPKVTATVGGKAPSKLGMDALLDFNVEVSLDGETLTAAEIKDLLAKSDGLALVRGRWVEVDHERLKQHAAAIPGRRTDRCGQRA